MKKIAFMGLMIVLFMAPYSYCIDFSESAVDKAEQSQELTNEQAEEMLVTLLDSIDEIDIERVPPNPDSPLCIVTLEVMLNSLLNLFPPDCEECKNNLYTLIVSYIVYSIWCFPY